MNRRAASWDRQLYQFVLEEEALGKTEKVVPMLQITILVFVRQGIYTQKKQYNELYQFLIKWPNSHFIAPTVRQELYETGFCNF